MPSMSKVCNPFYRESGFTKPQDAPALVPMPDAVDPLTLPLMQQAALMQASESHWKRAVVRRMLEDCQDKPATSDYAALAELGLAYRKRNEKWHSLTGEGTAAARALEPMLCKQLDIHDMLGPRRFPEQAEQIISSCRNDAAWAGYGAHGGPRPRDEIVNVAGAVPGAVHEDKNGKR